MSILRTEINSIKERLEKIETNLTLQANQVEERELRQNSMNENINNYKQSNSPPVKLNVGGICFTTCVSTLLKEPDTLLAKIVQSDVDLNEEIYIERSGELFKIFMNYLRYGSFNYKNYNKSTLLAIKEEADFYNFNKIYQEIYDLTRDIELVAFEHEGDYTYKGKTAGTQKIDDLKTMDLTTGICCKAPGKIIVEINGNWEFEEIEIAGYKGDTSLWYSGNGSGSKIYTSEDKVTWTQVGTVSSSFANKIVTVKLKRSQGRYIKFEHQSFIGFSYLFVHRVPLQN